jgi:hypothetical protein
VWLLFDDALNLVGIEPLLILEYVVGPVLFEIA